MYIPGQTVRRTEIHWSWYHVSKNLNLFYQIVHKYRHLPWNKEHHARNTIHQPELTMTFKRLYTQIIQEIKML